VSDAWHTPIVNRADDSREHSRDVAIQAAHDQAVRAGEDGYIDPESGLFVFTAAYLTARGTCCDSDCRHCPYQA
jgi:hypothetical protein